jgi:hypothetical protein
MTPIPSKIDDLSDALARLESVGRVLAGQFGAIHFHFHSVSKDLWLVGGNPDRFPAQTWEPFDVGSETLQPYEKGTLTLPHGFRVVMLRPTT